MVIGKEVPVTGGRIDVLYVSQSGYPVIVETKLWRNPESKREVVAQVLDLAFAFSKWGFDQVEEHTKHFTSSIYGKEIDLKKLLETEFGDAEIDYEGFRENLDKNLRFGRFLVAVVGDRIRSTSLDITTSMNLYWVTTEDHEVDWFFAANTPEEALPFMKIAEGYAIGDATAEMILKIKAFR